MGTKKSAAFAAVGVLALGMAVARPAGADDPHDYGSWFLIKSADHGDFCMDASLDAGGRGHEVYIFKCHGRYNQRWVLTQNADHTVSVVAFDGRCLDVTGGRTGDRTPLQLYPCHLGPNQKFERRDGMLIEKQSGKCLTTLWGGADRNPIFIDDCTGKRDQRWATFRDY
jgi:hypothetical protein